MLFKARDKQWDLSERTLVVGVINATPDSFSDGGECLSPEAAASKAVAFEKAGADILDIGAESTRPGARLITAEEEMERLLPVLKAVFEQTALP
ncbi:MAG: dihydropteroate synthase, partial [Parcubacteria group bacterium GW2011_GWA2_43_17]